MTLILPQIPDELSSALQKRANEEGKTIDQVAAEILQVQLLPAAAKQRNLHEFAGTWIEDPAVTSALRGQDQIDPEMWK